MQDSLTLLTRVGKYPADYSGIQRVRHTIKESRRRVTKGTNSISQINLCKAINSTLGDQGVGYSKGRNFLAEFAAGKLNCEMACFLYATVFEALGIKEALEHRLLISPQVSHIIIKPKELSDDYCWETTDREVPIKSFEEYKPRFQYSESLRLNSRQLAVSLILGLTEEEATKHFRPFLNKLLHQSEQYPTRTQLIIKKIDLLQKQFDKLNNQSQVLSPWQAKNLLRLASIILKLYQALPKTLQATEEAKTNIDYFSKLRQDLASYN